MKSTEWRGVATAGLASSAAVVGFPSGSFIAIAISIAFVILIVWLMADHDFKIAHDEFAPLLLVSWGLVVTALHGSSLMENKEVLGHFTAAIVIWMSCRRSSARSRTLMGPILGAAAVVLAASVLLETCGSGMPGSGGLWANQNVTAALLAPCLAAVFLIKPDPGRRFHQIAVTVALMIGAAAILTGSRAAALAILAMVATLFSGRTRTVILIVLGVLLTVVIVWRFADVEDSMKWHRLAIWTTLIEMTVDHPLAGCGPGGLADNSGPYRIANPQRIGQYFHRIGSAESTPLAVAVRLGTTGLLLGLSAIIVWFRRRLTSRFFARPSHRAMIAAMVAIALFHDLFSFPVILWWWAALLGFAESGVDPTPKALFSNDLSLPTRSLATMALAYLMLWFLVQPNWAKWTWFKSGSETADVIAVHRCDGAYTVPLTARTYSLMNTTSRDWSCLSAAEALYWSREAVRIDPGKSSHHSALARVCARIVAEGGPQPELIAEARQEFLRATDLEPHLPWVWFDWAAFERRLGHLHRAHQLALRAVDAEPNFVQGWLLLARLQIDIGQIAEARQSSARANQAHRLRFVALTSYERRLVECPTWQLEQLKVILDTPE